MKTSFVIFSISLLMLTSGFSPAQITGTAHDFTNAGWNSSGESCTPCHAPHNTLEGIKPLWNHKLSNASYNLYSSSTFNGAGTIGPPDGASKLCLSCHDGVMALENFGGMETGSNYITGAALIGRDLRNDHPISFVYNDALAADDENLSIPSATPSGLGGSISRDLLFNNKMQCTSCHDPHNNTHGKFLRKSNANSALCTTCHNMGMLNSNARAGKAL